MRRPWPLGADDRPRSRAALGEAEVDTLREWLVLSVLSWTNALDDGDRGAAFAPLVLAPIEPARQVGQWATGLTAARRLRLQRAMADAIDSWQPDRNVPATILLVKLAGHIGGRSVGPALIGLLGKPVFGDDRERRDFAEATAFYGRLNASSRESRQLAYRLYQAGLRIPTAAIILLACSAREYGADIVEDIEIVAPEVVSDNAFCDPRFVAALRRFCANTLVDVLGAPAAIELALRAHQRGMPELREAISRFRLAVSPSGKDHFLLRDRLTAHTSRVKVTEIPVAIRAKPGSVAVNDKLTTATSIDRFLFRKTG